MEKDGASFKDTLPQNILITGSTGLVGSYLTKLLLERGHRVYALARSKENKSAKERLIGAVKFWDEKVFWTNKDRLEIVEGEITEENLGINREIKKRLVKEIEEIIHCAAVTQFNWPYERIKRVNVDGTKNVLDFAVECKNIKKINHISTAYISGDYRGIFREDDLDLGQKFNSTYEKSKFEAERLVHNYRKKGLWIDIFRPPLIVGDSKEGKTFFFMAFYQTVHIWCVGIFDVFAGEDIKVNMVNVDTLCESILVLDSLNYLNNTYHTFSSQTISFAEILDVLEKLIKFKRPKLVKFEEFKNIELTPVQKLLLGHNVAIFNPNLILDTKKTEGILKKNGFIYPQITRDNLYRILSYFIKEKFNRGTI